MSSKEEKPTLAGVQVKTRKRNIVVPSDPGSFADAVVQIVQDAGDGSSVESDLEAGAKALDSAELEYSRYSDTLFEVFFTGGRLSTGASLAEGGARLQRNVFASEPTREAILPYVQVFQNLTRRRPFLVRGLENTLIKLLLSLEFFDEATRRKIAIALALTFQLRIGVIPENVFHTMLNDRLVGKGTVLEVFTIFLQEFLHKDSIEDLVLVLTKAKLVDRLLELMPQSKRTQEEFLSHCKAAGLSSFVEWVVKREVESKVAEVQLWLQEMMGPDSETPPQEVLSQLLAKKAEHNLPESDLLRMIWTCILRSINMTGKNQQQIMQALVAKIKASRKLLASFATNGKLELALLLTVQVQCYEDNRLLKLFSDIVRVLYDADVIGEDTVLHWYKKGSHSKGRNVFLKDIEPFVKWLEEAEEDEEEEDA